MMSMRCDAVRVLLGKNVGCKAAGCTAPEDGGKANRTLRMEKARVIPSRKGGRGTGDTVENKAEECGAECSREREQEILHVTRSGMKFWFLRLAHH